MTNSEFTPNILSFNDLADFFLLFGKLHGTLEAFLLLKRQSGFVEGGEEQVLKDIETTLAEVDALFDAIQRKLRGES